SRRRHAGCVRTRLEQARHVPRRGGVRNLAAPAGDQRDPSPPHDARHRTGTLSRCRECARRGAESPRGTRPLARFPGGDRAAPRRRARGVRAARRGGLQARGDCGHARDCARDVEITAASCPDGAAETSRIRRLRIADCGFEGETPMNDTWTERLSEYIDGALPEAERAALEAHLAGCAACATTLDELRRVVARARALDDRSPATDLWPAIAEQMG